MEELLKEKERLENALKYINNQIADCNNKRYDELKIIVFDALEEMRNLKPYFGMWIEGICEECGENTEIQIDFGDIQKAIRG